MSANKKFFNAVKAFLAILSSFSIAFSLSACWWFWDNPDPSGIPDPLGSWSNINQLIERPADWQQVVTDPSRFALPKKPAPYNYEKYNGREFIYYHSPYGTFPAIDGSTVLLPLAAELGWQFLNLDDQNTRTFFNFSTTHDAYMKLIGASSLNNTQGSLVNYVSDTLTEYIFFESRPDIIFATHPSASELEVAQAYGVELEIDPICFDSFVFITHRDNPIDSLTREQVRKIYSGEITNFSQVGGNDEEIVAYQREQGSGSQTAMEEMVMEGVKMADAPQAMVVAGMGRLVSCVAGYENGTMSLGYTYKYYVDRLYKNEDIKILKIDGISPSDENVRNLSYPFVAPYNAVTRKNDPSSTGRLFKEFLLSEEGKLCIAQAGYVTLSQ